MIFLHKCKINQATKHKMKLILENFRCYTERVFEIPDNGLTLLWGSSGCGKTSIFKAINFVLFGKETRTTTFGCKRSRVELHFNDIVIVRTRTPNHLSVQTPTLTVADSAAQAWICNEFGLHFLQTSYMSQKCVDNFFIQTRDFRAELLRTFSIQNFDVESLKQKNKLLLKQRKNNLIVASNQVRFVVQEFQSRQFHTIQPIQKPQFILKSTVALDNIINDVAYEEATNNIINEEKKQCDNNWKKLMTATDQLQQLNQQYNQMNSSANSIGIYQEQLTTVQMDIQQLFGKMKSVPDIEYEAVNKQQSYVDQLVMMNRFYTLQEQLQQVQQEMQVHQQQQIQQLEQRMSALQADFQDLEDVEAEQKYLKGCKVAVDQITGAWNTFYKKIVRSNVVVVANSQQVYQLNTSQFRSMCLQAKNHQWWNIKSKTDISVMQEQMNQLRVQSIELHKQQQQLKQQLVSVVKQQHCPQCKTTLSIVNNTIMTYDQGILKQQLATIESQIQVVDDKMNQVQTEMYQQNQLIDEHQKLTSLIDLHADYLEENVFDLDADIQRNAEEYKDMKSKQNEFIKCQTQHQSMSSPSSMNESSTKHLKQEISKLQGNINVPWIESSTILKIMFEEQNNLTSMKKQIQEFEYELKQQNEYKTTLQQLQVKQAQLTNNIQVCLNHQQQMDNLSQELQAKQQEVNDRKQKAERFNNKKVLIDEWKQQYAQYKEYQRLSKLLHQAQEQENVCQRALQCSLKMNTMINDAESSAMQTFLALLNEECSVHIEAMFDSSFQLKIIYEGANTSANDDDSSSSSTATKKTYVDVQIIRDGEEVPYECLSGGEADRCALAVFLAFNRLSKSKILLLDECLSSLHAESVEDIVQHIKTYFNDKTCIMTLHQTTQGIFDQVISLN